MNLRELLQKLAGNRSVRTGAKSYAGLDLRLDVALAARLVVACIIFAVALIFGSIPNAWVMVLLVLCSLIAGVDIIAAAVLEIMDTDYLGSSVLIVLSALIAFIFGAAAEGAALVLLYQLGGIFIQYAVGRTQMTVLEAVYCGNDQAYVLNESGEGDFINSVDVEIGDKLLIHEGERVPCDCMIIEGKSEVDCSDLGDDSGIRSVAKGDEIFAGSINLSGDLICEASANAINSSADAIYDSVENAASRGEAQPEIVARISTYITPAICVLAVLAAALLPLLNDISVSESIRRAAVFLAVANPLSVSVAAPLIRLAVSARNAKNGVIFRDCAAMDTLAKAGAAAFSKSGTLTDGDPNVVTVKSERMDPKVLLKIAAHAMAYSNTPQARSVIAAYNDTIYIDLVENFTEVGDSGVEVTVDGIRICAGNRDLMTIKRIPVPSVDLSEEYAIYISIGTEYAGRIILSDAIRSDAAYAVSQLGELGVEKVVMFTDESRDSAAQTAASLGIIEYYSEHSIKRTRDALSDVKRGCAEGEKLLFIGAEDCFSKTHSDADCDIAISGLQALTTPVNADVTVINNNIGKLPGAISSCKFGETLMLLAALVALLVKVVLLVLGAMGISTMWFAAFVDACVAAGAALVSSLAYTGPKKPE